MRKFYRAGPAYICESQDSAVKDILDDKVQAGDVVIIRYEGPRGGAGMQEMLHPTSYLKSRGLGKVCARLCGVAALGPAAAQGQYRLEGLCKNGDQRRQGRGQGLIPV